jgi:hypothetical protein
MLPSPQLERPLLLRFRKLTGDPRLATLFPLNWTVSYSLFGVNPQAGVLNARWSEWHGPESRAHPTCARTAPAAIS